MTAADGTRTYFESHGYAVDTIWTGHYLKRAGKCKVCFSNNVELGVPPLFVTTPTDATSTNNEAKFCWNCPEAIGKKRTLRRHRSFQARTPSQQSLREFAPRINHSSRTAPPLRRQAARRHQRVQFLVRLPHVARQAAPFEGAKEMAPSREWLGPIRTTKTKASNASMRSITT